eukprot:TRINITY_DN20124_c0_g1_i2.p1 TRINITY_DN20124_c0_g1~~TRINITY_DN20124_c0_g1_i2.p1  ORF type:complete len:138 (-),score=12.31 TRINITY_DN20124_c0_g1_i2:252-665(-)
MTEIGLNAAAFTFKDSSLNLYSTIDIIGYAGGFIIAFALTPQLYKIYRTRSADDISYGFTAIYATGLILTLIYLLMVNAIAAFIPAVFELICVLATVSFKFYLQRRGKVAPKGTVGLNGGDVEMARGVKACGSAANV